MRVIASPVTFEEFEQLPDDAVKRELLHGQVIELPTAARKHTEIALRLYEWLRSLLDGLHGQGLARNLGRAYREMGYRTGPGAWLQPDVSITHAGQPSEDYFTVLD
jgi:hypothetical protein